MALLEEHLRFFLSGSLCLLLALPGQSDDYQDSRTGVDIDRVVGDIVTARPGDREVMFINMVFGQLKKDHLFDQGVLNELHRTLAKMGDRKFEKRFGADRRYRAWLVMNLREMALYCDSMEADVLDLAAKMDASGHLIAGALNNTNSNQLLYLIRYLSGNPARELRQMENGRWITAGQLMVVMQFEQNQRNSNTASD